MKNAGRTDPANQLQRTLGLGSATMLVIANMIGTGIFTTSGFVMEALRDPFSMLLCWFAGGILALCGALCYGELGAMFPHAGGEYVYLRESFGKAAGFLSGWISLVVGFSAPIAAAAIAFSTYFFDALPGGWIASPGTPLFQWAIFSITPATLLAVGVIILFSLIHCFSIELGARLQNLLTGFKIAVIVAFLAAAAFWGEGSTSHFFSSGEETVFSGAFAGSLIFISFAYSGWNAAAYLGAEIKRPQRNIPLSLLLGTLSATMLYLLLNAAYIYALSPSEMAGVLDVGAKSALSLFGPVVEAVFSGAITFCLLSVISAMILTGPRVYYAMARDRLFFALFGRLTAKRKIPAHAIFLQAAIAIGMVVTLAFDKLLIYIGFTLSMAAALTVAGMMALRSRGRHSDAPYKTIGYPITPVLFILSNLWIIVFSIQSNKMAALCGAATIVAGLILYRFFNRKQGKRS